MEATSIGEKIMGKIIFLLRLLISVVFIYASIHKIQHPLEFAKQVAMYDILPLPIVYPFSFILPFLELICGVLVWVPKVKVSANIWNLFMMLLFIIAISYALFTGKDINCGCFGASDRIDISKLLMDAGLFLIIIWVLRFDLLKEKALLEIQNKT